MAFLQIWLLNKEATPFSIVYFLWSADQKGNPASGTKRLRSSLMDRQMAVSECTPWVRGDDGTARQRKETRPKGKSTNHQDPTPPTTQDILIRSNLLLEEGSRRGEVVLSDTSQGSVSLAGLEVNSMTMCPSTTNNTPAYTAVSCGNTADSSSKAVEARSHHLLVSRLAVASCCWSCCFFSRQQPTSLHEKLFSGVCSRETTCVHILPQTIQRDNAKFGSECALCVTYMLSCWSYVRRSCLS